MVVTYEIKVVDITDSGGDYVFELEPYDSSSLESARQYLNKYRAGMQNMYPELVSDTVFQLVKVTREVIE